MSGAAPALPWEGCEEEPEGEGGRGRVAGWWRGSSPERFTLLLFPLRASRLEEAGVRVSTSPMNGEQP